MEGFSNKRNGLLKDELTDTRVEGRKTRVRRAMARMSKLSLRAAWLMRRVLRLSCWARVLNA